MDITQNDQTEKFIGEKSQLESNTLNITSYSFHFQEILRFYTREKRFHFRKTNTLHLSQLINISSCVMF